ncbi:MAG TPA: glycosyltransferase family 2 protein [Rudaea sp.]
MAKNEADIIEAFVRHNLRFLDQLLVIDDGSADATPAILNSLAAEGLPLKVLLPREADPSFMQARRTTSLAYHAFDAYGADYVFPLDADEFLRAPSRDALEAVLERTTAEVTRLEWQTFVADPNEAPAHPLHALRWRVEAEKPALPKLVLARRVMGERNWHIGRGNHVFYRHAGKDLAWSAGEPLPGIALAHLPFRSPAQLVAKATVGWLSRRLSYGVADPGTSSWHFRALFERILAGVPITPADVRDCAAAFYVLGRAPLEGETMPVRFIEDPPVAPMPLRYTPEHAVDPLQLLAHWSSVLVERVLQPTGPQLRDDR